MTASREVALVGQGRAAALVAAVCVAAGRPLRTCAAPGIAPLRDAPLAGARQVASVAEACAGAALVVLAVPARALPATADALGAVATPEQVLLCHARGLAAGAGPELVLPEQVLRTRTCLRKIGLIGGALAMAPPPMRWPVALVVASRFAAPAAALRQLLGELPVALQVSDDVVGVQVAAAMAAVTALGLGVAAALQLGEMARGILMARGLAEATQLGVALGARPQTFTGLAGVGTLWPAPAADDPHVALGAQRVAGAPVSAAHTAMGGVATVRAVAAALPALGLQLPLLTALAAVLDGSAAPAPAFAHLLQQRLEFAPAPGREG